MKHISYIVFVAASVIGVGFVMFYYPRYSPDPDFAIKEQIEGISNFARITPGIWRGEAPDNTGLEKLSKMGVRTIIDFRTTARHEDMDRYPGIEYIPMPFKATEPPSQEIVDRFLVFTTEPDWQPVFFHCRHGKDRTGTMAAIYRIRVQGWDPEKALNEAKYFGFRSFYRDLVNFIRSQKPAKAGQ